MIGKLSQVIPEQKLLADGFQVAIQPAITKEAGIIFPVFFTRGVYDKYVKVPKGMAHQDEQGQTLGHLIHVCFKGQKDEFRGIDFSVLLPTTR